MQPQTHAAVSATALVALALVAHPTALDRPEPWIAAVGGGWIVDLLDHPLHAATSGRHQAHIRQAWHDRRRPSAVVRGLKRAEDARATQGLFLHRPVTHVWLPAAVAALYLAVPRAWVVVGAAALMLHLVCDFLGDYGSQARSGLNWTSHLPQNGRGRWFAGWWLLVWVELLVLVVLAGARLDGATPSWGALVLAAVTAFPVAIVSAAWAATRLPPAGEATRTGPDPELERYIVAAAAITCVVAAVTAVILHAALDAHGLRADVLLYGPLVLASGLVGAVVHTSAGQLAAWSSMAVTAALAALAAHAGLGHALTGRDLGLGACIGIAGGLGALLGGRFMLGRRLQSIHAMVPDARVEPRHIERVTAAEGWEQRRLQRRFEVVHAGARFSSHDDELWTSAEVQDPRGDLLDALTSAANPEPVCSLGRAVDVLLTNGERIVRDVLLSVESDADTRAAIVASVQTSTKTWADKRSEAAVTDTAQRLDLPTPHAVVKVEFIPDRSLPGFLRPLQRDRPQPSSPRWVPSLATSDPARRLLAARVSRGTEHLVVAHARRGKDSRFWRLVAFGIELASAGGVLGVISLILK